MTERPILFSGPMVRAILDGRKTQTRRVVKNNRIATLAEALGVSEIQSGYWQFRSYAGDEWEPNEARSAWVRGVPCPYGQPGDWLWVRETTWKCIDNNDVLHYAADGAAPTTDRRHYSKRPAIYMPRWASRITLEVAAVRVERVQDITEADAEAEGCWRTPEGRGHYSVEPPEFRILWDAINAKRGAGWDANPWVWVVEFRRVEEV